MRALLLLVLVLVTNLPGYAAAATAESVPCDLEEVRADQQMFCAPSLVYDEEGEVIGGSAAAN